MLVLTGLAFVAGLALTLAASELFTRGLTRLGGKVRLSEGLIGLLAALGADSPELSSAITALLAGAGTVGVGVIVGSNLFNIAALLGLTALVARGVRISRGPLLLDAGVGLLVTVAAAAMVAGLLPAKIAAAFVLPIAAAYVLILGTAQAPATSWATDRGRGSWLPVLALPLALAGVVGGSYVMVHEALAAQGSLHLPAEVLGTIVLAALTSLPNLWVALHFARSDRGTALFSTATNSNTINLVGGLIVPALLIGLGAAKGSLLDFVWLIGLTLVAVLAALPRSRLGRGAGVAIIAIYLVFVALRVVGPTS